MIRFKATEKQVLEVIANAINASELEGAGGRAAIMNDVEPEHLRMTRDGIDIKRYSGRRAEIAIAPCSEAGTWEIAAGKAEPDPKHQTWADTYPTYRRLLATVPNIEVIEENPEE